MKRYANEGEVVWARRFGVLTPGKVEAAAGYSARVRFDEESSAWFHVDDLWSPEDVERRRAKEAAARLAGTGTFEWTVE